MKERRRINYDVKNGENFKVEAFSIDVKRLNTITYQITTWGLYLTNDDLRKQLRKISRDCRLTLFQYLDTDIFGENYIVIDNIAETKPKTHQTSLVMEFTLYPNEPLPDEFIVMYLDKMTEKMNKVFTDNETFIFSKNKHKRIITTGNGDDME